MPGNIEKGVLRDGGWSGKDKEIRGKKRKSKNKENLIYNSNNHTTG